MTNQSRLPNVSHALLIEQTCPGGPSARRGVRGGGSNRGATCRSAGVRARGACQAGAQLAVHVRQQACPLHCPGLSVCALCVQQTAWMRLICSWSLAHRAVVPRCTKRALRRAPRRRQRPSSALPRRWRSSARSLSSRRAACCARATLGRALRLLCRDHSATGWSCMAAHVTAQGPDGTRGPQ